MLKPLSEHQERALLHLATNAHTRPSVAQIGVLFSRCYVDGGGRVTTRGWARITLMDGQRCHHLIGADKRALDREATRAVLAVNKGLRVYADDKETVAVRANARRAKITLAAIDLVQSGEF